jgi:dephospho-CoA kinase
MIVIGLTGSIGMGKTTTAALFAEAGAKIYDADAEVRGLYAPGGAAVAPIEAAFPGATHDGAVDRTLLSQRVLSDPAALARLNAIVWPLMRGARATFFDLAKEGKAPCVVLDIPLLLESGGERGLDAVVVASAPAATQRERVLARQGMTEAKFDAILAAQMSDAEKRAKADFVVDTGQGIEHARRQVAGILSVLRERAETGH